MMTVFVLNLHYRGPKKNEIPFWLQQLLIVKTIEKQGVASGRLGVRAPPWAKMPGEKYKTDELFTELKISPLAGNSHRKFLAMPLYRSIQFRELV